MQTEEKTVPGKAFISINEAATRLGIHSNTLRASINRGEFPSLRIGRTIRISAAKVAEIEAKGTL